MNYIQKASDIYFGLSPKEIRKLAFEYSQRHQLPVPKSWMDTKMAGEDWLEKFTTRHPRLSIRKRPTRLARATSFNRTTVGAFFTLLKSVYNRLNLVPRLIWDMNEMGVTTVQRPQRVVSRRDFQQIGRITPAERGLFVTLTVTISAQGDVLPPFFIFPGLHFKSHFLTGAPTGSDGAVHPSGWMTADIFLQFLQHFQRNVRASADNPVLLLLNNQEFYLSIEGLEFCKEHFITLLSLPPYTTHKLQPLDRSVFGPLKKAINTHCDLWITNNPGKKMSVQNIPTIINSALPLAATSTNIKEGFSCTGISPLNPDVFQDNDFSQVTDCPNLNDAVDTSSHQGEEIPPTSNASNSRDSFSIDIKDEILTDDFNDERTCNDKDQDMDESLQSIRQFPKAPTRKASQRGRKRQSSEMLAGRYEFISCGISIKPRKKI